MSIRLIDVGEEANDETGDTLRDGGIIINENFAELDARTEEAQAKADQGVADAAAAREKADQGVADAAAAQEKADQGVADAAEAREVADEKLSKTGGDLSGPLLSSSNGRFTKIELTSTTETLVLGGEPHAAVGVGPVISIAKNTNMVSEFIVGTDNAGYCPRFNLLRSRGSVTVPTAVADTNLIGAFQFLGYSGAAFNMASSVSSSVDGAPSPGVVPAAIQFYTTGESSGAMRWQVRAAGDFQPGADNRYDIGGAGIRPKTLWAATGTISTSDAREKTPLRKLSVVEIDAAKALGKEIGSYRWLAAMDEKGESARNHIGMTVQRAIEVMSSFGLDPFAYGFICHDAWEESVQASPVEGEDPIVVPAGDRYSFRIDELNLFLAAGFEARLSEIESKFP
ncbi:tail fiber domain-containing protein [Pseudomonas protegens]|uniref:tail fiber domain-containing protein n=1 Tax=Pseudomonas protegens TaxID=380021 RepID=UPI00382619B1